MRPFLKISKIQNIELVDRNYIEVQKKKSRKINGRQVVNKTFLCISSSIEVQVYYCVNTATNHNILNDKNSVEFLNRRTINIEKKTGSGKRQNRLLLIRLCHQRIIFKYVVQFERLRFNVCSTK